MALDVLQSKNAVEEVIFYSLLSVSLVKVTSVSFSCSLFSELSQLFLSPSIPFFISLSSQVIVLCLPLRFLKPTLLLSGLWTWALRNFCLLFHTYFCTVAFHFEDCAALLINSTCFLVTINRLFAFHCLFHPLFFVTVTTFS